MKNTLFTLLFSTLFFASFSQDLSYDIHGKYLRAITIEKLTDAKLLRDFIDGYPKNWVNDYVSVEISAALDGKSIKAVSQNEILNSEQQSILNKVGLGTDLVVKVNYKSRNAATDVVENRQMNVKLTIIPNVEAEFIGGRQQLNTFLKENGADTLMVVTDSPGSTGGIIEFAINEQGEVENSKVRSTSGDSEIDKLLLNIVNKMPKWKPAVDSNGKNVKQLFIFSVGRNGC